MTTDPQPDRYRKRPVEVDTVQWTGDNEAELIEFTGHRFEAIDPEDRAEDPEMTAQVFDVLHSTWVGVYTGQHIVRGVKGEFYPIAEDVLAETYEPAAVPVLPPADRAALRDRIAAALLARIKQATVSKSQPADALTSLFAANEFDLADAVLAVLPEPADRAAVLREAADELWALANRLTERGQGVLWAAERLRRVADEAQPTEQEAAATLAQECLDRPAVIRWCADRVRSTDGDYAVLAAAEYLDDLALEAEEAAEAQPTTKPEPDGLRCVCGDPVQLMDDNDPTSWIHSPGSDTRCLEARPRCPHCQLPHDLTPGNLPAAMCQSFRASIADAEQPAVVSEPGKEA